MKKALAIILSIMFIMASTIPAAALKSIAVKSIKLDRSNITLNVGATYMLKVTLTPTNTTQKTLSFVTNNKNIATVDKNGKITAVAGGQTLITVVNSANKKIMAKCTVTVSKKKPITFTMFCADPNPKWSDMKDDVGKVITEKTGVTLKVEFAVGDPKQKIALITASGEYPDLISPKYTNLLVDAGALLDLTKLIDKNAPNIKKVYGDFLKRQRWSLADQSIYEIATVDSINNQYFDATGGFELQYAVVKELGYPTIRTLSDYENAIKAYIAKYPKIDGKDTIGLSLIAEDWRSMISVRNPAFQATGAPDNGEWYIDPVTFEAKQHYLRPEEKEYFRWLNHMNDIGLLDKETFTQKYDQYKAKIATGTVLGLIDQEWEYGDGENALRQDSKQDSTKQYRAYAHFPVTLNNNYKANDFNMPGFSGGDGTSITTKCKDPVRAIQFLDFLSSDEGQILNNWGIKDKHYKVDANGVRYIPQAIQDQKTNDNAAFTKKSGIGNYRLSIRYGDGVKDSTGSYYSTNFPEQVIKAYPDAEKEVLKGYGINTWMDLFPKPSEFTTRPYGAAWMISVPVDSDLNVMITKFDDIVKKGLPETILCSPDKFNETYDKFIGQLKAAGADRAGKEFTKYVKDKITLWTK
jgi:putative aldouronate transport system substrate-binding protein